MCNSRQSNLRLLAFSYPSAAIRYTHSRAISRVTSDGQAIDWRQLTVGDSVALYGRPFHIVACDPATRRFLAEAGVAVAADGSYPQGPYDIAQLVR